MPLGYNAIPMAPDIAVDLLPGTVVVVEGLEPAIAAAWATAQARAGGRLFNDQVFSVAELSASRIAGHMVEYRLAVAAYADQALAAALGVRPLSVCGVLRMPDGILFGRRQAGATYEAGLRHMPPAGSVDAGAVRHGQVDAVGQIRAELAEEIGLDWERIGACHAIALVVHAASGVHDLGFLLETDAEFAEVAAGHAATGRGEYVELRAVPEVRLGDFVTAEAGRVVSATPLFLRTAGLA